MTTLTSDFLKLISTVRWSCYYWYSMVRLNALYQCRDLGHCTTIYNNSDGNLFAANYFVTGCVRRMNYSITKIASTDFWSYYYSKQNYFEDSKLASC